MVDIQVVLVYYELVGEMLWCVMVLVDFSWVYKCDIENLGSMVLVIELLYVVLGLMDQQQLCSFVLLVYYNLVGIYLVVKCLFEVWYYVVLLSWFVEQICDILGVVYVDWLFGCIEFDEGYVVVVFECFLSVFEVFLYFGIEELEFVVVIGCSEVLLVLCVFDVVYW